MIFAPFISLGRFVVSVAFSSFGVVARATIVWGNGVICMISTSRNSLEPHSQQKKDTGKVQDIEYVKNGWYNPWKSPPRWFWKWEDGACCLWTFSAFMNCWGTFSLKKGFWHCLLKEICESLEVGGTTCKSHGKTYSPIMSHNAIHQKMGNIHHAIFIATDPTLTPKL